MERPSAMQTSKRAPPAHNSNSHYTHLINAINVSTRNVTPVKSKSTCGLFFSCCACLYILSVVVLSTRTGGEQEGQSCAKEAPPSCPLVWGPAFPTGAGPNTGGHAPRLAGSRCAGARATANGRARSALLHGEAPTKDNGRVRGR